MNNNHTSNLDISKTHLGDEIKRRTPWILLSLLAGIAMVVISKHFEEALAKRIELVFFIPMIVYISDSIGTETLALFVRGLALRKLSLKKLLWREVRVGLFLGLITGVPMGIFSYFWFKDVNLSSAVTITMTINGVVAVLVGMFAPIIFSKLKKDPALGTDEITTALSDNISMFIYLVIATLILFKAS